MHTSMEEALLYLFLAAALGSLLGNLKWRDNSLGVASVLFVGLAIGAIRPDIKIPDIIKLLGLAIFVYSIGLSSGASFFSSLKNRGVSNLLLTLLILGILSLCIGVAAALLGFDAASAAGLLAGITTNTPALAGLLDAILKNGGDGVQFMSNNAVVGYSISYPAGVLGLMIALSVMQHLLRVNYAAESKALSKEFSTGLPLVNQTIKITQEAFIGATLRDVKQQEQLQIVFGRLRRDGTDQLCHLEMNLQANDLMSIVGEQEEVARTAALLGEPVDIDISGDRSVFDVRRIFVSNPKVAGQTIASLNLHEQYSVVLTRIRRGDVDSLITSDTVLELGDRIRVLARKSDMKQIAQLFGDSYEHISHIDLLSFGFGMGIGILIGSIEMTLPGNIIFSLGFAGGPLVAGLVLSYLRRSGPILWALPYSANLTLRQIGLMLMLAAIGINSGSTFLQTMLSPVGPQMLLSGLLISVLAGILILFIGYKWLKIPFVLLSGMVSHHPANLDFANNRAGNKLPTYGYALAYPLLLIGKIIFVQALWLVLRFFE
ncbi:MAG TPA: TrkA C-terminal domain-containing protein [Saprospiraceae bacterium]|mgnify:CR=1 FL=1|nr:TrkA C-terminal domain-containing protein [Saprospiraceae bacterium]HMP12458.1 TrkA C-terminal domain-containing protein [Saprospiraceae bacterium]